MWKKMQTVENLTLNQAYKRLKEMKKEFPNHYLEMKINSYGSGQIGYMGNVPGFTVQKSWEILLEFKIIE
jgi:hypothetical protein